MIQLIYGSMGLLRIIHSWWQICYHVGFLPSVLPLSFQGVWLNLCLATITLGFSAICTLKQAALQYHFPEKSVRDGLGAVPPSLNKDV